jgi:solute carrier family 10 (sodium/bile acid cotransporter), member 7
MLAFLKKQWFFVGIAVMVALAFSAPGLGMFVREYKMLQIAIFLTFLITGMTLDTSDVMKQFRNVKVLIAAVFSSLFFFPIVTYFAANVFFTSQTDFIIGAIIIATAPVTIASGTVMTGIARGNISLSLFICVLCNMVAIFTVPPLINLLVSGTEPIELPVLHMMMSLVSTILLPTIIGQALQFKVRQIALAHKKKISIFNQSVVLLIIFNAVAGSTTKLVTTGGSIIYIFLFVILLHNAYLYFNYRLAKCIQLDRASVSAFTIHTSQKTLTVSYLVWSGYLAESFPMALIPCIAYHLTQSICDTILAGKLRQLADREELLKVGSRE